MTYSSDMETKIVEAAIACIEQHGIQCTTVRRIAQQADVNAAAINYYFRSKEQLMERVLETTLKNAFDWDHYESSRDFPPKQRLAAILDHLTTGAQNYPEITRAHFIAPVLERNVGAPSYARFREFSETLYLDLVERGAPAGEGLRFGIIQAVTASILGIGLFLDLFGPEIGKGMTDAEVRKRYIDRLVDRVL